MDEHRIPANPMNYTVWYGYAAGSIPDLVTSLERF
jgi:hypothetical protein